MSIKIPVWATGLMLDPSTGMFRYNRDLQIEFPGGQVFPQTISISFGAPAHGRVQVIAVLQAVSEEEVPYSAITTLSFSVLDFGEAPECWQKRELVTQDIINRVVAGCGVKVA